MTLGRKPRRERIRSRALTDEIEEKAEPLDVGNGVERRDLCESCARAALGQLAEHGSDVAQVARRSSEADEIERRRFGRRNAHRSGLGLDHRNRSRTHSAAHVERDARPPDARGPSRAIRDDLEQHRLLVSCSVERRRAEQADVVRLLEVPHEVIDEPGGRRRTGVAVLDGDDDVEASARSRDPLHVKSARRPTVQSAERYTDDQQKHAMGWPRAETRYLRCSPTGWT